MLKNHWFLCSLMSITLGLNWMFVLFASVHSDPFVLMESILVTLAILGFIKRLKTLIVIQILLVFYY